MGAGGVRNTGFLTADGAVPTTLKAPRRSFMRWAPGDVGGPEAAGINQEAESLGDAAWGDGGR